MARPSKTSEINYAESHNLTHGLLERATCPSEARFVLLKDSAKKGLRLRITKAGGKHWQFESRIQGRLFTRSLGAWPAISIEQAREDAHNLRGMAERGIDPREAEAQKAEETAQAKATKKALRAREATTAQEAWNAYLIERTPDWGTAHINDHERLSRKGGQQATRGTRGRGVTNSGPLYPLLNLPLKDLTAPTIEAWAATEGKSRPTVARLAYRLLRAFLSWCAEHPQYSCIVPAKNPARTRRTRAALGKANARQDSLLKEQLPAWFAGVRGLSSPTVSAYLQTLLITGARPGEIIAMRWSDIDTQWRILTLKDKMEKHRTIPLTPYVWELLNGLPRINDFVFASHRKSSSAISEPNHPHDKACQNAGIEHLTLHGLRRSFTTLTEWLDIPSGVIAQIQGHKPSATIERHYTVRPIDMLRMHHERIERWILEKSREI